MNLTIREAKETDYEVILQLIKEFAAAQKTPEQVTNSVELMKKEKEFFNCLVADVDGKIAGFANFFFSYYSWSGKSLYLNDLYVTGEFRGKKIGTALMKKLIALAKAEDCKKLRWQVSNWNEKAIDFYRDFGAKIGDVEINCDLNLA